MINCYEYCINRAKYAMSENFDDGLVLAAGRIAEMEEELQELRVNRWQFATIGLNRAGSPVIEVLDKPGMKASVDREEVLTAEINKSRALFAELNPIFAQAQDEFVRFTKPTLKELAIYRQECLNRSFLMGRELKDETAYKLTSGRTKDLDLQGVLEDPEFVQHKQQVENTIKGLQAEAKKAEEYITKVEGILRN